MTPQDAYHVMATIAFPAAAAWALVQWWVAVRHRKAELRWKRAEAAWKLMDDVFEDADATLAFELVDGERSTIPLPGGGEAPVAPDDIARALALGAVDDSAGARAIRYAFNCMLYALDRLEGAIASGYVVESDVDSPTRYYARILRRQGPLLERYARDVGYQRAWALVDRMGRTA